MSNRVKLPNKASDLIDLALYDLELCERSSKYKINMYSWHRLKDDNLCYVCLAGSIISQTLKYPIQTFLLCDVINYKKELIALDKFRIGDVWGGLITLNKKYKGFDFDLDFDSCDYDYMENKHKWKLRMRKLIRGLRKENL